MPVAVVLAFAGALIAAVGTAVLTARLIRVPRGDLAAWSCVLLALAVALGAQTMGFARGFTGPAFRTAAVAGLLIAPLWTAWGLVELAGRSVSARFACRLLTVALTVVPGVILILDPLNSGPAFGKTWPGEARYMTLPRTALTLVHVLAVAIALLVMILAALRTRRDAAWWDAFVPVAAAGAAVLLTVSVGLALPNIGYPLLAVAATGSVWFAANRSGRVHLDMLRQDQSAGEDDDWAEPQRGRRRRSARVPVGAGETALALPDEAPPGWATADGAVEDRAGDESLVDDRLVNDHEARGRPGDELTAIAPGGSIAGAEPGLSPTPAREPPGGRMPPRLFGLIAIYTLLDGGGEEFDRLAERTVEAVRRNEPDTLLFVVHTVPKAPMQRIFYEVYRDRMAYAEHRRQPQVEEFFAMHRPFVLATNVIELDLAYAKVSALPSLAAMFSREVHGDRR